MKQLYALLITLLLTSPFTLYAQVGINTDASAPDASAMLDIKSTTKGMLIPRLTSALRLALPAPANGLLVFDTDTKSFWYFITGSGWTQLLIVGGPTTFTLPYSDTVSSGGPLFFVTNSGAGAALKAVNNGTGYAANFMITNSANMANALNVTTNSFGSVADPSQGNAGNFFNNNANGVGAGVRGEVNSNNAFAGTAGVYGVSSGKGGYAGYFDHTGNTGTGVSVQAVNHGKGTVLIVDHEGTTGDLAAFQTAGVNKARISRTGKGFFDGGTQNNGADVAEAFDVEGPAGSYEPGDVLLISTVADRTVVRSNEAYSSLVAGVYATKPGVLLTDITGDGDLNGKVPMGVVGVIPTRVCDEGGPIRRGDILVTSSRPGYAMRADLSRLKPGQAIGKALQAFDGQTGKINVLVNVK